MHKLRAFVLLLLFSCAICDVVKSIESTKPAAISTTKLTKTVTEQTKSKTEKRDSSDQTAYPAKSNDEPFRPIYGARYQDSAPAAPSFRPTTVRYMAAEAAPQSYYDKTELVGGIQYAPFNGSPRNAAGTSGGGGIHYASSAYRGPFNPAYQHQQQQQQQQSQHQPAAHAAPQQVKSTSGAAIAAPSPQQQTFTYAEPEYVYDRLPQQQPLASPFHQPPQHHHHRGPQHHMQYVIAIPLSYVRQLEQQLSGGGGGGGGAVHPAVGQHAQHVPQAYSIGPHPSPVAQPMLQVLSSSGPLARDNRGMYRPFHYSNAVDGGGDPAAAPQPAYTTQYIQVPASVLLAAAHAATLSHRPSPAAYQPMYYMPQQHAQPIYQQQAQPIYQHAQQQQQAPLYAYPLQQQPQLHHQQQQQHPHQHPHQQHVPQHHPKQHQQQLQQQSVVRIGGLKPAAKGALPPTTPNPLPTAQHSASPIVHYNPIYVQAPPSEQHGLAGALSFSRYFQGLQGPTPHPITRVSAPSALVTPAAYQHQYYAMSAAAAGHPFYADAPQPAAQHGFGSRIAYAGGGGPGPVPYFSHPGGSVHYGTHLYHPPTPTTHSKALDAEPKQGGNNQQQQQQAHASHSVVEAATSGVNVVKYP